MTTGLVRLFAVHFVKLAQLALAISGDSKELPGQLDRLFFRIRLQYCESTDKLFRFSERPIGHGQLAIGASNACA